MSHPRIQVDWEAHLEALPLATWITIVRYGNPDSNGLTAAARCGPIFVNRACRELLGLAPKDASTIPPWADYLHPDDREASLRIWADFVEGRIPRFSRTIRWVRPDTQKIVSLAVRAQKLHCGDIQGWLRTAGMEDAISRLEELAYA